MLISQMQKVYIYLHYFILISDGLHLTDSSHFTFHIHVFMYYLEKTVFTFSRLVSFLSITLLIIVATLFLFTLASENER